LAFALAATALAHVNRSPIRLSGPAGPAARPGGNPFSTEHSVFAFLTVVKDRAGKEQAE
jgi:hypothetical protein